MSLFFICDIQNSYYNYCCVTCVYKWVPAALFQHYHLNYSYSTLPNLCIHICSSNVIFIHLVILNTILVVLSILVHSCSISLVLQPDEYVILVKVLFVLSSRLTNSIMCISLNVLWLFKMFYFLFHSYSFSENKHKNACFRYVLVSILDSFIKLLQKT